MEEKVRNILSSLDSETDWITLEEKERWIKTTDMTVRTPIEIRDRKPYRKDKIKRLSRPFLRSPRLILYSQDPLWSVLDSDFCNLLSVLNNSRTYNRFPQQELQIVSAHQEVTERECIGSTDVYRKGLLVSRAQWRLRLSNDVAFLKITVPSAIASRIARAVRDWYDWFETTPLVVEK